MTLPAYHIHRLPGGPRLAIATLPQSECAALSIYIPAGSRDELGLPAGLAHFVEHMVFKGTPTRSARRISEEIENAGGSINACTSEDQTVYEGRGDAEMLPQLAAVLADMVWNATFPSAEIELEREVIGEEITLYRESPADHLGDLISEALWAPHPLGNAISGSLESIALIDREALVGFRDLHHFRDDVVIAVAGPFSPEQAIAAIAPHLPATIRPAPVRHPFERLSTPPVHLTDARETDQLQLALAWHTPGRHHPARRPLQLLSLLLGEASSSRLFLELREERGLCYQISSDVTFFHDTGAFEISAGLDPASRGEALACIHREIADLVAHGPNPEELARAKRLIISQSKLAFESTSAHASWAGESLLSFGEIPSPTAWRDAIHAITADDLRTAAREVFSAPPAIAEISSE
jgi:predicted Zn-dependent peptidase